MWKPVNIQDVLGPVCGGDIALVTPVVVHGLANVPSVDSVRVHVGTLRWCDVGNNLGAGWG